MREFVLYTDGACSGNPGPGGWAFVLFDGREKVIERAHSVDQTTNNRMEMMALLEGLREIHAQMAATSEAYSVVIYIDSSYVVNGCTKWISAWRRREWKTMDGKDVLNRDLWEVLDSVCRTLPSKTRWNIVPGHSGIPGNEKCDELAVRVQKERSSHDRSFLLSQYEFDLTKHPDLSRFRKQDPFYMSYVNGILEKHATWSQCEARVKARPGAKFKKVKNLHEEEETLKAWGLL